MKLSKSKILIFSIIILAAYFFFFRKDSRVFDLNLEKEITFNDNGIVYPIKTSSKNVADFLQENKINLNEKDFIAPEKNSRLYSGTNIFIKRAVKISIQADGQKNDFYTLTDNVYDAIIDSQIELGEDDLVNPKKSARTQNDLQISITRVKISEDVVQKPIDFKTISTEDDKLGWRIKKVQQKGVKGIKEIKYRVVSHDGKEISRKITEENVIQEPTPETIVQGTFMKLGKAQKGDASYYASSWGELNASRTIPRGGFAKVTNLDNGKSTVIKINDYGPQSPARVIDMSYTSFAKIGDLGQGILHNVKVEQVLN